MVDSGALAPEAMERHPQANVATRALGAGAEDLLARTLHAGARDNVTAVLVRV